MDATVLLIRLAYVVWVVNVLFVHSQALPRLHQSMVHLASVGLAFASGEFFHARLLTASHLFLLDMVFGYSRAHAGNQGDPFAVLPAAPLALHDKYGRPLLAWAGSLGVGAIFALHLARLLR